ncbi:MAG: phosphatase PAP2 family protein [Gemmatimonadota bacterium]|nr:phosphatase PAP2 family protein [Gemmatimonadota bacterium]
MDQNIERPIERALSVVRNRTNSLSTAVGLVLIIGLVVAGITGWIFLELAETVQSGATLAFDDGVLRWMAAHQSTLATTAALELTALGTGTVVIMMTVVAGMFLALTGQRRPAILLVAATIGGMALNLVLKLHYHRPRPHIFAWATNVVSSSFPSGHAMNSVIVYGTIAYLAARLSPSWWLRALTQLIAILVIVGICTSRVYLGVHYPSDVVGGAIIGTAWAVVCMACLEGVQRIRGGWSVRPQTSDQQTDFPPSGSTARAPRA